MSKMPTEFVMLPPQTEKTREWGARLAAALPELNVVVAEDTAQAAEAIASAEATFGTIPPDLLRQAQKLRWLQAPQAAPPAGYYYPALIAHPVQITNFREIYNDHIGAHVMSFVLAFARGLHHYIPQQLKREWKKLPQDTGVIHLPEATALIVGVGGIGSEVARLAAAFGMQVFGVDERRRDAPPGVVALHRGDELDALLPTADFVILTVPHTPETEGFMNRTRFQEMKKTAFFINIGRGLTTRLDDLVEALRAGEIAGAGLDVFEQEPLPADHPLWTMAGVLLTPHVAGYGPYLDQRRYEITLDNCRRFLAGQPLRNLVDKARWF
jgi:phosphoglycerate dehydrogenase-like enzyme